MMMMIILLTQDRDKLLFHSDLQSEGADRRASCGTLMTFMCHSTNIFINKGHASFIISYFVIYYSSKFKIMGDLMEK